MSINRLSSFFSSHRASYEDCVEQHNLTKFMPQLMKLLCTIDSVYYVNSCFNFWLSIFDNFDKFVVTSHLFDNYNVVIEIFKSIVNNVIDFSLKNFVSNNIDYFFNFSSYDDTILCEKTRIFVENINWAYDSKILFCIFIYTSIFNCFSVIELCDNC